MEPGFLQSREFAISAIVAAVVVMAGIAVASTAPFALDTRGCSVPLPTGPAAPADLSEDPPRREREVAVVDGALRWALGGNESLDLHMCTEVGSISVVPSQNGTFSVHATIRLAEGDPEELHLGPLRWAATRDSSGLRVAVYHQDLPARLSFFDSHTATISYEVTVPVAHGAFDARLEADVGSIRMTDIEASAIDLRTDVGTLTLERVNVTGGIRLQTDVGDIRGSFATTGLEARTDVGDVDIQVTPLGSATWNIRTDVGDVQVDTVRDPNTGYDLVIGTDVGSIDLDLGSTERLGRDGAGASETMEARTEGFADATVQVTARIGTDVGAVTFTTR